MKTRKDKKVNQSGRVFGTMTGPMEHYQSTPQHTPTPWRNNGGQLEAVNEEIVIGAVGAVNVQRPIDTANARLIVRAVNSHEELLEACHKASAIVNYYRRAVMTGQIVETHPGALVKGDYEVMEALDKAIAKAEGR